MKTTIKVFESSVNSEGIETFHTRTTFASPFESSVNSEGIETAIRNRIWYRGV